MSVDYEDPAPGDQLFMLYLSDEEFAVAEVMHYAYLVVKQLHGNLGNYSENWKVKVDGAWKDLLFKKQLHQYIVGSKSDERKIELFLKVLDRTRLPKGSVQSGRTFSVEEIMRQLLSMGQENPAIYKLPVEAQIEKVRQELPQPKKY